MNVVDVARVVRVDDGRGRAGEQEDQAGRGDESLGQRPLAAR